MDGAELEILTQTGQHLPRLALKLFLTSSHFLWVYDYFLTLGDEIKYAWCGKRSWIFVLFIANRYTPFLYLIWVNITLFSYGKSLCVLTPFTYRMATVDPHPQSPDSCQATKFIAVFHTVAVTVLAQIAIALRIYALTMKNKFLGGPLLILISAQFCFGVYFITRSAISPAQLVPEINLDAFKICFYQRWQLGELVFTNIVIAFDLLAFLIIFSTARRPGKSRYPGIPSILDNILLDATVYYILVFVCQLLLEFFLFLAPQEIQFMPGVVNTILVPTMASRLMLSLKKAAAGPHTPWSLSTMTNSLSRGAAPDLVTIHFASWTPNAPQEIPESLTPPDEGDDIELGSVTWDRR